MAFRLISRRNPPPRLAASLPRLPGVEVVASVLDRVLATAQVGLAYGEPMTIGDRTIIPIGAVGYGFGAGFGSGAGPRRRQRGGGGGGGGGVNVQPVAFIEITKSGTRVRPVIDWTRITVLAIGALAPMLVRLRFRRRGERLPVQLIAGT